MPDAVTRHRIATTRTDAGGNTLPATRTPSVLPGEWLFAPAPSADVHGAIGRDGTEVTPSLYGPHDADVTTADLIEVRGHTYSVVGDVARWEDEGTVINLRRVDG